MYNDKRIVAWAIITANQLGKNRIELDFEDIEKGKNLDQFIGQSLEYDKLSVPLNRLSPGDAKRPIQFERTSKTLSFEDGVKYAALISENDLDSTRPYITCAGLYSDLENVKARKAGFRDMVNTKNAVLNDMTIYKVEVQGWKFRGTGREIVDHFTNEWEDDPTENLCDPGAKWFKKDENNRYVEISTPDLPPTNQILLSALKKVG